MLIHLKRDDLPVDHPVFVFEGVWRACVNDAGSALWSEFDPINTPKTLPWTLLLRPDGQQGYDYVICGQSCRDIFGFSYQGKKFGEGLPPAAVAERQKEFTKAIETKGPLFSQTELPIPNREHMVIYRGVFPFFEEGDSLARIAVILAPVKQRI